MQLRDIPQIILDIETRLGDIDYLRGLANAIGLVNNSYKELSSELNDNISELYAFLKYVRDDLALIANHDAAEATDD